MMSDIEEIRQAIREKIGPAWAIGTGVFGNIMTGMLADIDTCDDIEELMITAQNLGVK